MKIALDIAMERIDNPIRPVSRKPWKTVYEDDNVKITEGEPSKFMRKFGDTEFHVTVTEQFGCNKNARVRVEMAD